MAKAQEPVNIADVLMRYARGQKISPREAQAVTAAATAIRIEFLNDMFQAMQDPSALDVGAFKCMSGVAKMLSLHGFISSRETDSFMEGIGMME